MKSESYNNSNADNYNNYGTCEVPLNLTIRHYEQS